MPFNKKILFMALSVSLHNAIKGMEIDLLSPQQEEELKHHAHHVSQYLLKDLSCTKDNKNNLSPLLNWLVEQRAIITEDSAWKSLIKKLKANIQIPTCLLAHYLQQPSEQEWAKSIQVAECTSDNLHLFCGFPYTLRKTLLKQAYLLQPDKTGEQLLQDIEKQLKLVMLCYTHITLPF